MSIPKIEDLRFSSSSIDEFFTDPHPAPVFHRQASGRVRISGLHQLAGYEAVSEDTLVRVSKQDFWKLGQDDDGYFIERLVNDDAGPVEF